MFYPGDWCRLLNPQTVSVNLKWFNNSPSPFEWVQKPYRTTFWCRLVNPQSALWRDSMSPSFSSSSTFIPISFLMQTCQPTTRICEVKNHFICITFHWNLLIENLILIASNRLFSYFKGKIQNPRFTIIQNPPAHKWLNTVIGEMMTEI